MTLQQMKLLGGAAKLELTVDKLFRECGLPAEIVDLGREGSAKRDIRWNGTAMRLSATSWDVAYGATRSGPGNSAGWVNLGKFDNRCLSGLSQLRLTAKGNVGTLTVTKNAQGFGYKTAYHVPSDLYRAHQIIGVTATTAQRISVSTLVGRYGQPDEVLRHPGSRDMFRYWVLTLRDQRPELLYAVDFEIDGARSRSYVISSSKVGFVEQRLDTLLKQWERDYVLD